MTSINPDIPYILLYLLYAIALVMLWRIILSKLDEQTSAAFDEPTPAAISAARGWRRWKIFRGESWKKVVRSERLRKVFCVTLLGIALLLPLAALAFPALMPGAVMAELATTS